MSSSASDIAILISQVAEKDRRAFGALYHETNRKLFGVILKVVKNSCDADEALQETYLKVWVRAASYHRGEHSPISWLAMIARNAAIDKLRAQSPRADDIEALDIADERESPEQQAVRVNGRFHVEMALKALGGVKEKMVRSAYLDGYAYAEIANEHGVPLNTVRTWLRRGLAELRVAGSAVATNASIEEPPKYQSICRSKTPSDAPRRQSEALMSEARGRV